MNLSPAARAEVPVAGTAVPAPQRGLPGDAKISVHGRVVVGARRDLRQRQVAQVPGAASSFFTGLPESGLLSPVDVPSSTFSSVPTERLEWEVAPVPGEVAITDAGLTAAYGIFGAPGSGKTHLLLGLLHQLLGRVQRDDPERRFGGLILDPKAALVEDVREMVTSAGRAEDLVVLSLEELTHPGSWVNLIDVGVSPRDLGQLLVLAGQSAGSAASEPFWFVAWRNLFGPALELLDALSEERPTLRSLAEHVLTVEPGMDGVPERPIQELARRARAEADAFEADRRADLLVAADEIDAFYRQEAENIETVNALISGAYGDFRLSRWHPFSRLELKVPGAVRPTTFYDRIIDEGKVVLVSVSPDAPVMARVVCTLVKVLFQQTVISRLGRVRQGTLRNFTRPVLLACDEYSGIASEVPGQPMGDGYFFSVCRQNGCMGLIATQSVTMLQSSGLKEAWKGVFANFGGKIFLRLADNETAEEATKLVGESDWVTASSGASYQAGGGGYSSQRSLQQRKDLPAAVLTQVLTRGIGIAVGSLDGAVTVGSQCFEVPADPSTIPQEDDHAQRTA